METRAPNRVQLAVMVLFALSCFGLLLYLWAAFGGPVPLKPKGYRFTVAFSEATQLAEQGDVRISGVNVGKVVKLEREAGGRTRATIELQSEYAPIPSDARATLRQKTLLAETYVELTPGARGAPPVPDGGALANSRVADTVELDEVLRVFDRKTRADLRTWLTEFAGALDHRALDINDALGSLGPAVSDGDRLFGTLDRQSQAVSRLVRDTGRVFGAIGDRDADAGRLIRATDDVLSTTAARDDRLAETLRILPTFLREVRPTLAVARATADDAAPVVRALRPVAPLVEPALRDLEAAAPDLRALFRDLDPVLDASATALPALRRTVDAALPLVRILDPIARDLAPAVDYLGLYKQELVTSFSTVAAATQASFGAPDGQRYHYLRAVAPVWNEGFVTASQRQPSNRHNAYFKPRALDRLKQGLEALDCRNLSNPATAPVLGAGPPKCVEQAPLEFRGVTSKFPRLQRDPRR